MRLRPQVDGAWFPSPRGQPKRSRLRTRIGRDSTRASLFMRKCKRVIDGHRSPFVAGVSKLLNSERLFDRTHVALTDPPDFRRQGAADASEHLVRNAPEMGSVREASFGGEPSRKYFEAPGDAARILKLLTQQEHF